MYSHFSHLLGSFRVGAALSGLKQILEYHAKVCEHRHSGRPAKFLRVLSCDWYFRWTSPPSVYEADGQLVTVSKSVDVAIFCERDWTRPLKSDYANFQGKVFRGPDGWCRSERFGL